MHATKLQQDSPSKVPKLRLTPSAIASKIRRRAWRLALFGVLSPLGRLVEAELKDKLDDEISLSWQELRASDLSGRARAMLSMVNGGMAVTDAVSVAGLMVED